MINWFKRFKKFIDKIEDTEILKEFIKSLGSNYADSVASATPEQLKNTLKSLYSSYSTQTNILSEQRKKFEEKVNLEEYSGEDYKVEDKLAWISLIDYEKGISVNQHPKILFIIEKAMTYIGVCPEIWEIFIQYLENVKGDRDYLKSSLAAYKNMLFYINLQAIFVLADIYELEGETENSRELYTKMGDMRGKTIKLIISF